MKIALIGTHGTGKTTLAHELVAELKKKGVNAGFLGEIAGECPLPINENTSIKSQKWIFHNQCKREIEEERKYSVLICDRSVLDNYVYYNYKFGENKAMEEMIREGIKEYDFLFRLPLNDGYLKDDGIRSINTKFQKEINNKFDVLLKEFSVTHYITNNLEEILQMIKDKWQKDNCYK